VDTHADVHVAAAVDAEGSVSGLRSFAKTHPWLTAKVTANGSDDRGVRRTSANPSAQSVGEYGRLRLSMNTVESAWETDALSPELRGRDL
jgi:hypothetical protein